MKRILPLCAALFLSTSLPTLAEDAWIMQEKQTRAPLVQPVETLTKQALSPMDSDITLLQTEWAKIKYQISDKDRKLQSIHALEEKAAAISAQYPDNAEPKIWEGIILSTDAEIAKGLSALGKVRQAKTLFETALQENPNALDGSAHTSLGSLYYQVPGWPVAFGNDEEAEKHLKWALQINPNGMDANYFYGDFLLKNGHPKEAKPYLNRALQAPDRPNRELADAGRKQEIRAAIAQAEKKLNDTNKPKYN